MPKGKVLNLSDGPVGVGPEDPVGGTHHYDQLEMSKVMQRIPNHGFQECFQKSFQLVYREMNVPMCEDLQLPDQQRQVQQVRPFEVLRSRNRSGGFHILNTSVFLDRSVLSQLNNSRRLFFSNLAPSGVETDDARNESAQATPSRNITIFHKEFLEIIRRNLSETPRLLLLAFASLCEL